MCVCHVCVNIWTGLSIEARVLYGHTQGLGDEPAACSTRSTGAVTGGLVGPKGAASVVGTTAPRPVGPVVATMEDVELVVCPGRLPVSLASGLGRGWLGLVVRRSVVVVGARRRVDRREASSAGGVAAGTSMVGSAAFPG